MADRQEIAWMIWAWHNRRAGYRLPDKMPQDSWFGLDGKRLTKGERQIRDSCLELAGKIIDQVTGEPAEEDVKTESKEEHLDRTDAASEERPPADQERLHP